MDKTKKRIAQEDAAFKQIGVDMKNKVNVQSFNEGIYKKIYAPIPIQTVFTSDNSKTYIKIQGKNPTTISNLRIRGYIVINDGYETFEVVTTTNYIGFSFCNAFVKTKTPLIANYGFLYLKNTPTSQSDDISVLFSLEGNLKNQKKYHQIIIEEICGFDNSIQDKWEDFPLEKVDSSMVTDDLIFAQIWDTP